MPAAFLISALIQFALGLVVAWLLGPSEFGFYALALAASVLVQTLAFEWLRLAATRFHHAGAGPSFERALLRWFALPAAVLGLVALLLGLLGGERRVLLALVPLMAIVAGFADLRAAMLRAEFESRAYALFLALRNGAALIALPAAAAFSGRAELTLGAFSLSVVVACAALEWQRRASPSALGSGTAESPSLSHLARYSTPVVATNLAYLCLFFLIRAGIAWAGGMAAAGQASLALDFVLKLFTTAGTAFDLLFFQLAVRDERQRGEAAGRARITANFGRLLMLIAPMAIGLAFVIARIEPYLVGPEFRGAFAGFVLAAVPGVATYAVIQYGLHPAYQLRQETGNLLIAATVAGSAGSLALGITLATRAPTMAVLAVPILVAMAGAAALLLRGIRQWAVPVAAFWLRLGVALAIMSLTLGVTGRLGDGMAVLALMLTTGMASYCATAWLLNLGEIRALLRGSR